MNLPFSPAVGIELLRSMKYVAGAFGPQLSLPVGSPVTAILRPVATRREYLNKADIELLSKWRNRFVKAFLNEFVSTEPQTAEWLVNTVGLSDTKILFMLEDLGKRVFGYMGIAFINWETSYGEADAIVRGADAPKGIMTASLKTLISWARGQLGLKEIGVRVRSDNTALEFYRKVGFIEEKRIPLKCTREHSKIIWEEDLSSAASHSSIFLVYMKFPCIQDL